MRWEWYKWNWCHHWVITVVVTISTITIIAVTTVVVIISVISVLSTIIVLYGRLPHYHCYCSRYIGNWVGMVEVGKIQHFVD